LGILGILGIENRKLKIGNWKKILSFQAGNNYQIFYFILFLNFFRGGADDGLLSRGPLCRRGRGFYRVGGQLKPIRG
jgi:hypothetical protein